MFAEMDELGVEFVVKLRILREARYQVFLNLMIIGLEIDPAVPGENAMRVGIDHERRQIAG